jgi:TnpA family transposase
MIVLWNTIYIEAVLEQLPKGRVSTERRG